MAQIDRFQLDKYYNQVKDQEALLNFRLNVLNKGFVEFLGMNDKEEVIPESARISYSAQGQVRTDQENKNLTDRLIRNHHTSPVEQLNFSFHIKLPIFVMRQLVRHRTARLNEISGRYSVLPNDFYIPELQNIQIQSKTDKQGRELDDDSLTMEQRQKIQDHLRYEAEFLYKRYLEKLEMGISRELARINLPLSIYTEIHWNIDLHNLFNFLRLRLDSHAQWEIREFASAIYAFVKKLAPMASESFENHILESLSFSKQELQMLEMLFKEIHGIWSKDVDYYADNFWEGDKKSFERFLIKLKEGRQV